MSQIRNEELAKIAVDQLWKMLNDPRLKNCTAYEAARKIGLGEEPAKIVEKNWDGPVKFPG